MLCNVGLVPMRLQSQRLLHPHLLPGLWRDLFVQSFEISHWGGRCCLPVVYIGALLVQGNQALAQVQMYANARGRVCQY